MSLGRRVFHISSSYNRSHDSQSRPIGGLGKNAIGLSTNAAGGLKSFSGNQVAVLNCTVLGKIDKAY